MQKITYKSTIQETNEISITRVRIFIVLTFIFFIILVIQLFRWQILFGDKFKSLALNQTTNDLEVETKRGVVTSADGVILAADKPVWDVYISVSQSKQDIKSFSDLKETIIAQISEITGQSIKSSDITNLNYTVIAKEISDQQKKAIEQKHLFGVFFIKKQKRFYPNGQLASHIIGFVGVNSKGQEYGAYGIEGYFWGDIKGKTGKVYKEKTSQGQVILTDKYKSIVSREGRNVQLTIQTGTQAKVEEILKKGVESTKSKSGTAIILNPHNGAVIAMANYPEYDPNFYWEAKDVSIYRNKAIADVYEYGSIQKPLTVAIAIEEKKINNKDICDNSEKFLLIQDKQIWNFDKTAWGKIPVETVLKHSINICTAKYGLMIGKQKTYDYLVKLGLNSSLNIGLQEEEDGSLRDPNKWLTVELATISFGQGIVASPLQILSALSVLANDGVKMKPYLVQKIYNKEETIETTPQSEGRVFSSQTIKDVTKLLLYDDKEDYQYLGNLMYQYDISGKTGTAQIASSTGIGYEKNSTNASFVGYAPAFDPSFIMLVRLERPEEAEGMAGQTARPVWLEIFKAVADDLGVKRK